ncbi:hypothetical protein EIN_327310 [Entamoeba invadens IP1]|uniref:Uncharacterized protein n=1 Tax=Entamoeba invadens IP1 TaxID=370355 RepID=A0A0A1TXK4_ENTIV|nr:hypothetical protein EIN_327310 [Entamoeba invadens IP1]ELP86084.1 hypothetical protein EIN_327310 [Entamoeba invadens IP1]|eukprot:XP_004185430.1 hypothetical protein EIN_327310 [Entamoeba invadens IP1]
MNCDSFDEASYSVILYEDTTSTTCANKDKVDVPVKLVTDVCFGNSPYYMYKFGEDKDSNKLKKFQYTSYLCTDKLTENALESHDLNKCEPKDAHSVYYEGAGEVLVALISIAFCLLI